jgi:Uma2 family endonuclease
MIAQAQISPIAISLDQYLSTSFEGVDPEFIDGELVDRAMPTKNYSLLQILIGALWAKHVLNRTIYLFSELRLRISPSRVRVPDLSLYLEFPTGNPPSTPPYLVIEILSPDDRFTQVLTKCHEYAAFGVPHSWLIDPENQVLYTYAQHTLREVMQLQLPVHDLTLTADIFTSLAPESQNPPDSTPAQ